MKATAELEHLALVLVGWHVGVGVYDDRLPGEVKLEGWTLAPVMDPPLEEEHVAICVDGGVLEAMGAIEIEDSREHTLWPSCERELGDEDCVDVFELHEEL